MINIYNRSPIASPSVIINVSPFAAEIILFIISTMMHAAMQLVSAMIKFVFTSPIELLYIILAFFLFTLAGTDQKEISILVDDRCSAV